VGLLDDLKDDGNFLHSRRGVCSVCTFLETLGKEESLAIKERLEDKNTSSSALSRVLKNNGHNIQEGTLARHRRGMCASGTKG
jgi:hypothetical protein